MQVWGTLPALITSSTLMFFLSTQAQILIKIQNSHWNSPQSFFTLWLPRYRLVQDYPISRHEGKWGGAKEEWKATGQPPVSLYLRPKGVWMGGGEIGVRCVHTTQRKPWHIPRVRISQKSTFFSNSAAQSYDETCSYYLLSMLCTRQRLCDSHLCLQL